MRELTKINARLLDDRNGFGLTFEFSGPERVTCGQYFEEGDTPHEVATSLRRLADMMEKYHD